MTNLTNKTTTTNTNMEEIEMTKLTVKELKAMAKDMGLKGYSRLRKKELIDFMETNKEELYMDKLNTKRMELLDVLSNVKEKKVSQIETICAKGVSKVQIIGTIGDPIKQEKAVTKIETNRKEDVEMKLYPINTYVMNIETGVLARIAKYGKDNEGNYMALVLLKKDLKDDKVYRLTKPAKELLDTKTYRVVALEEVKALHAKANSTAPKKEEGGISPSTLEGYEINVDAKASRKDFYLTNKKTRDSVKVDTGASVDNLIKTYEDTIQGLELKVTEYDKKANVVYNECKLTNTKKRLGLES